MASQAVSMRKTLHNPFNSSLTSSVATVTPANLGADVKSAGPAAEKVRVCLSLSYFNSIFLTLFSHAVYASTRRRSATNVCSSAMRRIPRKTAYLRSTSTRAVWRASDLTYHNIFRGGRCTGVETIEENVPFVV